MQTSTDINQIDSPFALLEDSTEETYVQPKEEQVIIVKCGICKEVDIELPICLISE